MNQHIKSLSELRGYISRISESSLYEDDNSVVAEVPQGGAKNDDSSSLKSGDVTLEQVIEKINTIRAGKSLRDETIKVSLKKYFSSLDKAERVALLAFLKGISQVVSGEISGEHAVEPSDPEPQVKMKKKSGPASYKVKPRIDTSMMRKGPQPGKGQEDTTPPIKAPISPKG